LNTYDFSFAPAEAKSAARREADPPPFPPLAGRHVALRPVMPADYQMLQMLETNSAIGAHWRFRGQTPSPDKWVANLWNGVLCQHLIFAHSAELPIGLVCVYRASFQDRHAYLSAVRFELEGTNALMMRGLALFIQYVFGVWDFRKLYLESPSYNVPQFASGIGRFFEVQGRLTDHYEYAGRFWDLVLLTIDREAWLREGQRVVRAETSRPAGAVRLRMPVR
jgi:hypothetical protein